MGLSVKGELNVEVHGDLGGGNLVLDRAGPKHDWCYESWLLQENPWRDRTEQNKKKSEVHNACERKKVAKRMEQFLSGLYM